MLKQATDFVGCGDRVVPVEFALVMELVNRLYFEFYREFVHAVRAIKLRSMIKITFIEHSGESREVEARTGNTLMQTAAINLIPGIEADCGGACSCATCHVYVDPEWIDAVGSANPLEDAMLSLSADRKNNSRLSCQIVINEDMDGLKVTTPASQY